MVDSDINTLIARRGQIKAVVTRFQNFIRSSESDLKQIPLRQIKVEEAWQNFELVQTAIEEADSTVDQSQYRIDFENLFFETVAEAEQKTSSIRVIQNDTSVRNADRGESVNSTSST